jgi:glycosyltransferase involved in cell wall biosynthesis
MIKRLVVAIPVRDEEERLGACLTALARQTVPADEILVLLNNCRDGSLDVAHTFAARMGNLTIMECNLEGHAACAGEARRQVLIEAAARAGDGVVLTTDADAVVPPDWLLRNISEIAAGAEAVCGRAVIDPVEAAALPQRLHEAQALEQACRAALDRMEAAIDPDEADPWPRHQENSGASIAVTTAALARAGGPPAVGLSEDRALIAALGRVDARIRHAPGLAVTVSGRLDGRAAGGMADTICRRLAATEAWADDALEPAIDAYRRALARARLRRLWAGERGAQALGADLLIGAPAIREALDAPYFGIAWARVQALSPVLARRRVAVTELAREGRQADLLRAHFTAPARGVQFAD